MDTTPPEAQSADQSVVPTAATTAAAPAEDDVIDKAWIEKTKQIVLATANDPAAQSRQLAALKAEYLQKRYNKTVNTATS